jgi:endonuclease-8
MPEGDTIHRVARSLRRALIGSAITGAAAHARTAIAAPRLVGLVVREAEPRAKHLLLWLGEPKAEMALHTHLGMTGSWHLYRPGERWAKSPAAVTVRLDTAEWVAVCFSAPVCELLTPAQVRAHPVLAALGPDLAAPEPDLDEARRRLDAEPGRPLADVLLDQRVFAGVGNVYKSELCFLHALHPLTPVGALSAERRDALVADAARLLHANAVSTSGGRATTGPGERGRLHVYGRAGAACRRCGTRICSARLGDPPRRTDWCPRCQPA